ncbi:FAD-dependent oxidoreductase [Maribellus maritimus]|uniref:FAD-dependent oxidoreductase n=1 Tax=Maribellus maritimus TaxID=2870838 RepID=UPI001EEBA93A|nr:FAD-dependent oxidoreductase [Maribellus maritimus]MCG6189324.1 FAD-dependent oxidoreductase [Maribellus maritimus]
MYRRRNFIKKGVLAALGTGLFSKTDAGDFEKELKSGDGIDYKRNIPLRYEADVVVIGGGIAGVSAAASAAVSGAKVILIERFANLGGMLTTGGVANFCGQIEEQGEVFDQILKDLKRYSSIGEGARETVFNFEILSLVLQEILLERGVKILLHTHLVDVLTKGNDIKECIICGKSGLEAVRGKVYIDCSGDADMARYAGVSTMKGDGKTGYQLPMSKMAFVREVNEEDSLIQVPDNWPTQITSKEDLPMVSVWPDGPGGKALKIKIPMFDSTSTEGITNAEIQARRRTMDVLSYYQKIENKNWRLTHSAPMIGVREGCRVEGDYILTVDDLRAGKTFDDGVARGTFYLDGHGLTDDKRTYILPKDQLNVPPYQIPMRCLISKDADNLLVAGRCLSAEQLALSSARVSTTCSMMGQATGIAAGMAVLKNTKVRKLDYKEIQKEVLGRGAQLDVSKQIYRVHG